MVLWLQQPPKFGPASARTDSVGPGVHITDVQTPDDQVVPVVERNHYVFWRLC